jgi:hypothetical protein
MQIVPATFHALAVEIPQICELADLHTMQLLIMYDCIMCSVILEFQSSDAICISVLFVPGKF